MNQIYQQQTKMASMKMKKSFKTTDLALTMALLIIISCVSGSIVSEAFQDSRSAAALSQAETLAVQLSKAQLSSEPRLPASENSTSEISKDPWGLAYHYKILKDDEGRMNVIVVSSGPNKKLESDLDKLDARNHVFSGDDVGYFYDPKSNVE